MSDLTDLGTRFVSDGAQKAIQDLNQYTAKAKLADQAAVALTSSTRRLSAASVEMQASLQRSLRSLTEVTRQERDLSQAADRAAASVVGLGAAAALASMTLSKAGGDAQLAAAQFQQLNLGIGEAAASAGGLSTLGEMAGYVSGHMVSLALQGAELGSVVTNVSKFAASLLPVLVALAPALVVVASVGGLAAAAFGLFERAVDKHTKGATTWADTWQAAVNIVGRAIMNGPIGDALRWLQDAWDLVLDHLTAAASEKIIRFVVPFVGAYRAVIGIWRLFPAAIGDLFAMASNLAVDAMQILLNAAISKVNTVFGIMRLLPQFDWLPGIGEVDLSKFKLQIKGAAADVATIIQLAFLRTELDAQLLAAKLPRILGDEINRTKGTGAAGVSQPSILNSLNNSVIVSSNSTAKETRQTRKEFEEYEAVLVATSAAAEKLENEQRDLNVVLTQTPDDLRRINEEIRKARSLRGAIENLEDVQRAADGIVSAVDGIFKEIKNKDWSAAFAGLLQVIQQVADAFDETGNEAQRLGAVGGLLSGVGSAVGGSGGMVLNGIGSGFSAAGAAKAMSGTLGGLGAGIANLAGPIGIAVAGFSLLSGILGKDDAKKRAKLEKEAQDIQNARTVAQERANKRAELELRILELSGDELGALTKRREAELAALDSANRLLAEHVHKLEDWAKAVQGAKDAVSKAQDDLRASYDAERERLQGVMEGVEAARERLREAYDRERSEIEATIGSVRSLVESLTSFRSELDLNPLAANDPIQQYMATRQKFQLAGPGDIPTTGAAFVEASLGASATRLDFEKDLAAVRRAAEEAAQNAQQQLSDAEKQLAALDSQVAALLAANDNLLTVEQAIRGLMTAEAEAAIAEQQLAALDAEVGALIAINQSVLSVAQAIANLNSAIQALAAAEASKPADPGKGYEAVGWAAYVDKNADLAALYAAGSGMARGRSKDEFAQYHWERYGQAEDRYYRPFARGGVFTNGLVLEPTAFNMGVMGENEPEAVMPLVMGPNGLGVRSHGDAPSREELAALRRELEAANRALTVIAISNSQMLKQGDRIEAEGVYSRGETPGEPLMTVAA